MSGLSEITQVVHHISPPRLRWYSGEEITPTSAPDIDLRFTDMVDFDGLPVWEPQGVLNEVADGNLYESLLGYRFACSFVAKKLTFEQMEKVRDLYNRNYLIPTAGTLWLTIHGGFVIYTPPRERPTTKKIFTLQDPVSYSVRLMNAYQPLYFADRMLNHNIRFELKGQKLIERGSIPAMRDNSPTSETRVGSTV